MADERSMVREKLRRENREFRKLEGQHDRLEKELDVLIRHRILTPPEELYKKQIQVEKLHTKDRIEAMLRKHREEEKAH